MIEPSSDTAAFRAALDLVLKQEGGRVDDPHDPGGRTNQGITQATYDAWRHKCGLPHRAVYAILSGEVAGIYRHDYADPLRFDDLPAGLAYAVFDAGVNSGVTRAAMWLQAAVHCRRDGSLGLLTLAACRTMPAKEAIDAVCDARFGMLRHLPTWAHFGRGWSSRIDFVREHALAMAGP